MAETCVLPTSPTIHHPEVHSEAHPTEGVTAWAHAPQLAKTLHYAEAALVAYLAQVIATQEWKQACGVKSLGHWVALRAGVSPARAQQLLTVASRAFELPHMMAYFADAKLSLDQAVVIATFTPTGFDEDVTALAAKLTVTQLRRLLRNYVWPHHVSDAAPPAAKVKELRPSGVRAPDPNRPATLSMSTRSGRFYAHFECPEAEGAVVKQALLEATDALYQASKNDDADASETSEEGEEDANAGKPALSTPRVTTADAFIALALQSLNTLDPAGSRAANYRTYIHLDARGASLTGSSLLPDHVADKLTCDGVCQPVWETDGVPVSVGREQRIVPARTKRLLEHRDRGCRFPGCTNSRHLEAHHIHHWRDGGGTDVDNLVLLCSFHHDEHHRGTYSIVGDPRTPATDGGGDPSVGLVFKYANGTPITVGQPTEWQRPTPEPSEVQFTPPTGASWDNRWTLFTPNSSE